MISRAIQWCVLSLSLLVLAPGALAFSVIAPQHDCCPGSEHTPCNVQDYGSMPATAASPSCCVAVPSPLPVAATGVSARVRAHAPTGELPDAALVTVSTVPKPDLAAYYLAAFPNALRSTPDSAPVYLLTRRLRL